MAENEAKKEEGGKGGKGGGPGKMLFIMLGVNTLLVVGVLAFVLLRGGAKPAPAADAPAGAHGEAKGDAKGEAKGEGGHGEAKAGEAKPAKAGNEPGPSVKFPDFVIHLRDPEVDRYARLTVEVEVADDKAKDHLTARMPPIRDAFISYLSDRTTADMRGSEAIAKVKVDLAEKLRGAAPGLAFRALYITELVVQ